MEHETNVQQQILSEDQDSSQQAVDGTQADQPTQEASAKSPDDALTALYKELEEAKAKASEYLDGWQRARAEFANYKKRQEQQSAEMRAFATIDLIRKLLPIQDDFERAIKTLPESMAHLTWIEGVLLIHRKLQMILEGEGVKAIEVKANDPFDPVLHEAISHDEAEGIASGHIIEEVQKGYKLGERVIRPTLVRVAK